MLALDALKYRYPGGVEVLAGVDLQIRAGELCALVGANGAGKSTLLRLAAVTLKPDAGVVRLFGSPCTTPRQFAARVAWICQDPGLDPNMTGAEHLELQAALMGLTRSQGIARIADLADGLELGAAIDRFVSGYSGGMRRRLHLALGLLHDPELLILDEPTAGLDPDGQNTVWRYLTACAARGRGLLVVSHDLGKIVECATRVVFLDRCKLVGEGAPAELARAHEGGLLGAYASLTGGNASGLLDPWPRGGGRGRAQAGGRRSARRGRAAPRD